MNLRLILAAVVLLLALTACAQSAETAAPPTSEPAPEVTPGARSIVRSDSRLDEQEQ
jgi:hypothetical protein